MSEYQAPIDQTVREQAIDPTQSFIVQAPAGSGKTGLLTQRYLKLLSCVERPESIVAITFTRKAAGEMQERILHALQQAQEGVAPEAEYEKLTWRLACDALQQDQVQCWSLLDNPGRLQIQTFDSFCSKLAAQMPLLSNFGAVPAVTEEGRALYLQAAEATLAQLEGQSERAQHIAVLLRHLDNRLDNLRELLADMLARRDQWLRHVADPGNPQLERENIEQALQHLVEDALVQLQQHVPIDKADELLSLLRFAASYSSDDCLISSCHEIENFPEAEVSALNQWQAIAEFLQTKEGAWRKRVTKAEGFPAPSSSKNKEEKARLKEMKDRMLALLASLDEDERFRDALAGLNRLPASHYTDQEWEILNALFSLLPYSVAYLRMVFQEKGEVDFTEISLSATQALGRGDDPSDLALKLDYQIQHLLVDEFQDTSINQHALIKNLIAGWENDDGRSLFLVGDPMQSIYRFREAEVGLFLETCEYGLAQKSLCFLQLQVNFRSCKNIIDWANLHFPHILPKDNDPLTGAVSYAASVAAKKKTTAQAVAVHAVIGRDDLAEANKIIAIIQATQNDSPEQSMAILVRNRSHLFSITHALRENDIRFHAVDIDALVDRPVVQDLLALTQALLHPADRISWLAVLRAPFCGLTLLDLHQLCNGEQQRTLIDLLNNADRIIHLSADGQQRIQRVLPILNLAIENRSRTGLRHWVERIWLALGGPACVTDDTAHMDADAFFVLLEELGESDEIEVLSELQSRVERLYAQPDARPCSDHSPVQVMTIHKAKGLEFDTVIIPGLGKSPKGDNARLLYWLEQPGIGNETDLLFGPIKSARDEHNKTAEYIQALENEKKFIENARLLYVAVTRAKQQLHLFAHSEIDKDNQLRKPGKNTLLACLWPVLKNMFETQLAELNIEDTQSTIKQESISVFSPRSRLTADWQCPSPPPGIQMQHVANINSVEDDSDSETEIELEFDWAGDTARHVGIVVHRLLEQIAAQGVEQYQTPKTGLPSLAKSMLIQAGVARDALESAVKQVSLAIENALADERGRWMLSNTHQHAVCELALSIRVDGEVRRLIIDRSFVDKNDTRWIIDYKTGAHSGGDLDAFLDNEQQRYRFQLQRYAAALQKMESRKIRMALYFPVLKAWREWG